MGSAAAPSSMSHKVLLIVIYLAAIGFTFAAQVVCLTVGPRWIERRFPRTASTNGLGWRRCLQAVLALSVVRLVGYIGVFAFTVAAKGNVNLAFSGLLIGLCVCMMGMSSNLSTENRAYTPRAIVP